jgi:hypothetical protein
MEASEREEWDDLYRWVGILFLRFARLECHLNDCLRFNLTWKIDTREWDNRSGFAAAVYGSQRFKTSRDTIKRIVQEEGRLEPAQIAALGTVFEQIGHIAALRDKFAHQVFGRDPSKPASWLISDTCTTRDIRNSKVWSLETKALIAASSDIRVALEWIGDPHQSGTLLKKLPTEPPTWRYKSSALELLTPEKARALREMQPPPQSSEG